jgi:hypothetical protein
MEKDWMDKVDWNNEFKMLSLYSSEAERFFSWSSSFTYQDFKAFIFQLNVQVGESLLTLQRDFSIGNYDPLYVQHFLEWRVSAKAVSILERATYVNVVNMINEHPLEYKTDREIIDCIDASTEFRGVLVFGVGPCAECAISNCAKKIYGELFESEKLPCYVRGKVVPIPLEKAHDGLCPPLPVLISWEEMEEDRYQKYYDEDNAAEARDFNYNMLRARRREMLLEEDLDVDDDWTEEMEKEYNETALEEYNEKVASDYLDRPWL